MRARMAAAVCACLLGLCAAGEDALTNADIVRLTGARLAPVAPAPAAQPKAIPGSTFRDSLDSGGEGPETVVIPAGRFGMGCLSNDADCFTDQTPVRQVTIPAPFALSMHEVTFEDYDRFAYPYKVDDRSWGRGSWARHEGVDELLSEFALAHVEGSRTVAAYVRDDLLEKRHAVMQAWSDYVTRARGN